MSQATHCPIDFKLVFPDSFSDGYEMSRVLGYGRGELKGKTLVDPVWSDQRGAAAAVAAILAVTKSAAWRYVNPSEPRRAVRLRWRKSQARLSSCTPCTRCDRS